MAMTAWSAKVSINATSGGENGSPPATSVQSKVADSVSPSISSGIRNTSDLRAEVRHVLR